MAASILGNNLTNYRNLLPGPLVVSHACLLQRETMCGLGKRVSSVLNRDVKQFGKQFLFDGNEDTCWNSDTCKGSVQWINLELDSPALLRHVNIQFQGGFVGHEAVVEAAGPGDAHLVEITKIYPDDVNKLQSFDIDHKDAVKRLRLVFTKTTDFFSRIIIYHLDFLGEVIS